MLTATVKGFERFSEINADVDTLCLVALSAAAEEAAAVAQASSTVPLDVVVDPAAGDVEGFSSGIVSRKAARDGSRLAVYFDGGTLGGRTRKLKQPRRASWTVHRGSSAFTAHRHPITAGEGIHAERFFGKARAAGRKVLLDVIDRGF